jgi:predicted nucleic acid-binding protein
VDTSVLSRLSRQAVAAVFGLLAAQGRITVCAPVAFELGYAARSPADYRALAERLLDYPTAPTTDADHRRALEIQAALATTSRHRALALVDALVAATAEARDMVVLHYDAHFELVSAITGQPHEWIVPPGAVP